MLMNVAGATTYVSTGGQDCDPSRPCLVFVHGAGFDHSVWQQQSRYFAHRGYCVLAVDLPGHGASAGKVCSDVASIADWLVEFMDAARIERAVLIGHSLGALAVLETAARYPERVTALALLGVAARMPVHPDLLTGDRHACELIADWGHGPKAHRGGNVAPGIWLIQSGIRLLEKSCPSVLATDLAAANDYKGATEAAGVVRCPTLFVFGERDRMTPPKGAASLLSAMPEARQSVIGEAGHMMMLEAPGETLKALKHFLDANV
jgi:pimeloyl-ACP methyl ester carboxylesterase